MFKEASSSDPIRFDEGKSKKSKSMMISLERLLADCVEASFRGCRDSGGPGKSTFSSGKVTSKIEGDARSALTEADVKAQAMVIGSLRKQYEKRTEYRRGGRRERRRDDGQRHVRELTKRREV